MLKDVTDTGFQTINRGYNSVFHPNQMSFGLVAPIETYTTGPVPTMARHLERVQLAEELGFSAIWLRDIPFNVPAFGDAGQTYDPFVYLGLLAGQTKNIALGVSSIILPLRHPAHVAKAAATVDVLSGGRLILGIASGDRPEEFPALNIPFDDRGAQFRESFAYIRRMSEDFPVVDTPYGRTGDNMDMLPKPVGRKLPLLITGGSQQAPEWLAQNGDGWMVYPRNLLLQEHFISNWRAQIEIAGRPDQPVLQPLYIDLVDDPDAQPETIHLGFRSGIRPLLAYLQSLKNIGLNHLVFNLRFNQADIETTMKRLADEVLPVFAE